MKKLIPLLFLSIFSLCFKVSAQTTPASAAIKVDSTVLQEYVGKYKMKGAPFENVIVTFKDGKLMGEAEGQGSAELAPTKDVDIFEVVGYGGTVVFVRGDDKKVKGCQLNLQGNSLEGEKDKS